jgi:hypothetical protein
MNRILDTWEHLWRTDGVLFRTAEVLWAIAVILLAIGTFVGLPILAVFNLR